MAYTHVQYEVIFTSTGAVATGLVRSDNLLVNAVDAAAQWSCGYMPHLVKAVWVQQTATSAMEAAAQISFRDEGLGATTATGNQFTIITMTTAASNLVYYRDDFAPREIAVGNRITAIVTTASTGDTVKVGAWLEPRWESPANSTGVMVTG